MAYFYKTKDGGRLVNVSGSVGAKEVGTRKPAQNLANDVALIHFLLSTVYTKGDFSNDYEAANILKTIFVDPRSWSHPAICQMMANLIGNFQVQRNKKNPNPRVFEDGRIDTVLNSTGISSITHTKYTIITLQGYYAKALKVEKLNMDIDMKPILLQDPALNAYPHLKQELLTDSK